MFVTLDKGDLPDAHAYDDYFDNELFFWESQNRNKQSTPHILGILGGTPVLLFCRVQNKIGSATQPFVFCGRLVPEDYQDEQPVRVRFVAVEYMPGTREKLDEVYRWRPKQKRKLIRIEADTTKRPEKGSGQGRIADVKRRKTIELAAMRSATAHYASAGWHVEDTSALRPYDLECSNKSGDLLRVEVKGLSQGLGAINLTIGEVDNARDPEVRTDLFILYNIEIGIEEDGGYFTQGGQIHLIEDWVPDPSDLEAVQFRYRLK